MHSESSAELGSKKVAEWNSGGLSASLTAVDEEAQAEKEAQELAEAEEEKEFEETSDEARELDSENVRENDADGDSHGHGEGGQEEGEEPSERASEISEEVQETSEESTEENAEGDEVSSGNEEGEESGDISEADGEVTEETMQTAGEDVGTFEMTAYVAFCDTGCTGVTASGYDVSNTIYSPEGLRIVAADPGVLPLGTVVEIDSGGSTIQAVVMDTGGDINGNRLDLLVESEAEALGYGRRSVAVRIID